MVWLLSIVRLTAYVCKKIKLAYFNIFGKLYIFYNLGKINSKLFHFKLVKNFQIYI